MTLLSMTIPIHANASDESLASLALDDANAFAELYRRHFNRIYRYHVAQTGRPSDAEDLTTQTFLAALEGLRSYRRQGCFAAWLMGIAHNKVSLYYRSHRKETSLDEAVELTDPAPLPDDLTNRQQQMERINKALHCIAPERAEAVSLCVFGGLNSSEAASVMGKTQAAVKMLLLRGLRDLREICAFDSQEVI